jgi:hypothetical protein
MYDTFRAKFSIRKPFSFSIALAITKKQQSVTVTALIIESFPSQKRRNLLGPCRY